MKYDQKLSIHCSALLSLFTEYGELANSCIHGKLQEVSFPHYLNIAALPVELSAEKLTEPQQFSSKIQFRIIQ